MININNYEKAELSKHIKNIDDLLSKDNIQDFLDKIDDIIVNEVLGNPNQTSSLAIKLQKIYDNIYQNN